MIQQIEIQKLECERLEKKIEEHIQWQISDTGKQANLPQIDKLHKEFLFIEWRAQINQTEKAETKTSKKSNEIIQSICDQIFKIELLKENMFDMFSGKKEVELKWRQRADTQEELIKKLISLIKIITGIFLSNLTINIKLFSLLQIQQKYLRH